MKKRRPRSENEPKSRFQKKPNDRQDKKQDAESESTKPRRNFRKKSATDADTSENKGKKPYSYKKKPFKASKDFKDKGKGKKSSESEPSVLRLNRFIAKAGVCSRRDADELIKSGKISVNGKIVTEMGFQVSKKDKVFMGKRRLYPEKLNYVLLNKPKNFITTTKDPKDRKTVLELVKKAGDERLYPVGRLDRNTTGLLLLTNDGELAQKLTHPTNVIAKIYAVELEESMKPEDFKKLLDGIELEDGPIKVDEAAILDAEKKKIGIEIHSGRNRIIRRIFEHLGYTVRRLDRTMFAGLDKKDLPRGHWRHLSEKEIVQLKYFL